MDLLHVKDAQIQTFSGGMKRRVSLAISAIGNPKIIIMDEPTSSGLIIDFSGDGSEGAQASLEDDSRDEA